MATRDRTGLFLRYREDARALHQRPLPVDGPPHSDLQATNSDPLHGGGRDLGPSITRGGMEPEWVFTYNDLKGDLAELEKMLEQLATLYAQHLLPSFVDVDTSHLEHEIHIRSHRLTDMLHSVEHKVRAISKAEPPIDESNDSRNDTERTIRRNLQKRFATPLQALSLSFRKRQKTYLEKLKQVRESCGDDDALVSVPLHDEKTQGLNINSRSGFGEYNSDTDVNGVQPSNAFSEVQLLAVENSAALAEERRRELNQVASNINDLATIVKDIAALVVDQGTVLDRVDYNLEDTRLKTSMATRELRIADQYQSKRHALCCIIILAIGCAVMTIILIYKWTA